MPQSLAKILLHTVFPTTERRPFLRDPGLREELHRYPEGISSFSPGLRGTSYPGTIGRQTRPTLKGLNQNQHFLIEK
jgi:hypothetical protein